MAERKRTRRKTGQITKDILNIIVNEGGLINYTPLMVKANCSTTSINLQIRKLKLKGFINEKRFNYNRKRIIIITSDGLKERLKWTKKN